MTENIAYELGSEAFADGKWRFANDDRFMSYLASFELREERQAEIAEWERGFKDAKAKAAAPKKKKKVSKKKKGSK